MAKADTPCIGAMRTLLTIQSRVVSRDPLGSETYTFSTFAQVWGNVSPMSGRELWNASQVQANVTHTVVMRYLAGVLPTMRIIADGQTLNIQSVVNADGRNRFLTCQCLQEIR